MEWIDEFLRARKEKSLLRSLRSIEKAWEGKVLIRGKELLNFSSNDYLGLSSYPSLLEESRRMQELYGTSSSASRLMSGDLSIHHLLEELVAEFKGKPAALTFGSGYLANVGIIPALCGKEDVIFSDQLNHTSIIDGVLLSGARRFPFRHNSPQHLSELLKEQRSKFKKALVVIETIYSMDGDRAAMKEIVDLKEEYDAILMVDEAHATGIFGPNGAGVVEEEGLIERVDIIMGTFGKALGSYGAYVAAGSKVISYLVNKARSLIYSTALPPSVVGANIASIKLIRDEPFRRRILLENAGYFGDLLKERGFDVRGSSQIVPVVVGENKETIKVANRLQEEGIFALPIRYPTVPEGQARIRFSVTYHHSKETLQRVVEALEGALRLSPK